MPVLPDSWHQSVQRIAAAAECDSQGMVLVVSGIVVGILATFQGYRIYEKAFGCLLCATSFGLALLVGLSWLSQSQGSVSVSQRLVVLAGCLLWTLLTGLAVWKERRGLQKCLAFLLGISSAGAVAMALLAVLHAQWAASSRALRFAAVSLAAALSVLAGSWAAAASQVKYLFMLVTSILGSALTVLSVDTLMTCMNVRLVPEALLEDVSAILLVCLGFAVQITFQGKSRQIHVEVF